MRICVGGSAEGQGVFAAANATSDPTVLGSPADQIELFGSLGFRKADAEDIGKYLRGLIGEHQKGTAAPITTHIPPVIVHLSDLHFGKKVSPDGRAKNMHFEPGDYSRPLLEHMTNELANPVGRFQLLGKPVWLVVSGDFAYIAITEEFNEALAFMRALRERLGLSPERVVFCPGNHDINWALSAMDKPTRFDNYISFLRRFYGDILFRDLYPNVSWDFSFDGNRLDPTDLISVIIDREHKILFASFNSCVYETEQHHYGFVSLDQQIKMSKLLGNLDVPPDVTKVAVIHHHIHPYPESPDKKAPEGHWVDMSTIRDGGLFERFLERREFDIVLHGHKHQPQLRETTVRDRFSEGTVKPLIVCGAGSCGVAASELAHSAGNHYQVLEFTGQPRSVGVEYVRIEWRELAVDPAAEWVTMKVWDLLGR